MKQNSRIPDELNEGTQQPFISMKFKIVYLENSQVVHEVKARNIDCLDLKHHLQAGETVEIIPEFADRDVKHDNCDKMPFYVTHF